MTEQSPGLCEQVGIWKIARTIEDEGQVLVPAPPNVAHRGCFGHIWDSDLLKIRGRLPPFRKVGGSVRLLPQAGCK